MARKAAQANGGVPIGCVIVRDGEIVGEGANEVATQTDPTAHAEIVAIRRACASVGVDLRGATLYSTLQPCGMCSMASIWSHVSRIVYGAERHQVHSMYFEDRHLETMDFIRDAFRDDMSFTGGVLPEDTVALYYKPGDDVPPEEQGNL
ncbi:MAG: nucleoside deaminase [Proteobacteria bacterium]|nr:nucleoside deaminase [Pseudomonadota bacterium]